MKNGLQNGLRAGLRNGTHSGFYSIEIKKKVEDGWNPSMLPDLILWLDPADESTVTYVEEDRGSGVKKYASQWDDKSGQLNHVFQATAVNQPVYEPENLKFVLTGNERFKSLAYNGGDISQPNTIIIVAKNKNSLLSRLPFIYSLSENKSNIITIHLNFFAMIACNFPFIPLLDGTKDINLHVFCCIFNISNSEFWLDGALSNSGICGTDVMDGISVFGKYIGINNNMRGDGHEVIVMNSKITETDRILLHTYLNNKYNVY